MSSRGRSAFVDDFSHTRVRSRFSDMVGRVSKRSMSISIGLGEGAANYLLAHRCSPLRAVLQAALADAPLPSPGCCIILG